MGFTEIIAAPYFIIVFTTGVVFVITGLITHWYPPKKINSLYGYRTSSSMLNQERWDYAQKYSSKIMIQIGVILGLCGILSPFIPYDHGTWISLLAIAVSAIALYVIIEKRIRRRFK